MLLRFFENGELKDSQIVRALAQAKIDYENGAVVEVRDTLVEIVLAINEFEKSFSA